MPVGYRQSKRPTWIRLRRFALNDTRVTRSCSLWNPDPTTNRRRRLAGQGSVNFPHLPTKNVVRYGAPAFVAGKDSGLRSKTVWLPMEWDKGFCLRSGVNCSSLGYPGFPVEFRGVGLGQRIPLKPKNGLNGAPNFSCRCREKGIPSLNSPSRVGCSG